jgi:hypothetical protein
MALSSASDCSSVEAAAPDASSNARVLYATHMDARTTWADLLALFEPFDAAAIATVTLDSTQKSRGFGYISYSTEKRASRALAALRGAAGPHGKPLELQYARADRCSAVEPTNKLFVRQVPPQTSGQQLEAVFAAFGAVASVRLLADRCAAGVSEKSGNLMAYVVMGDEQEACIAMKRTHEQVVMAGAKAPLLVRLAESENTRAKRRQLDQARRSSPPPTTSAPTSNVTTPMGASAAARPTQVLQPYAAAFPMPLLAPTALPMGMPGMPMMLPHGMPMMPPPGFAPHVMSSFPGFAPPAYPAYSMPMPMPMQQPLLPMPFDTSAAAALFAAQSALRQ